MKAHLLEKVATCEFKTAESQLPQMRLFRYGTISFVILGLLQKENAKDL